MSFHVLPRIRTMESPVENDSKQTSLTLSSFTAGSAMREFRPLDYVLLASGCMIFQSSITRIIVRIQKVLLLVIVLYFLSLFFPWTLRRGYSRSILLHASGWLDAVFAVIFVLFMSLKQEEMRILLETVSKNLDETRRDCLRKYAIVSSLLSWINVLRLIGFSMILVLRIKRDHGYDTYILITSYAHLINWLFGGIAVYGFFIKSITYMEEEYFDRLEDILKNTQNWSTDGLCIEIRVIMHLKEEIVTCFGPIPCLWLLHVFIRAAGIMFSHGSERQLTRSVTLAIDVLVLVWLIFLCDHSKQRAKDRSSHITLEIMRRGQAKKWKALVHELEEADKMTFTAWNMFTIRKMVIPVFIGSLTNFMVLISTMINDLSANNAKRDALLNARMNFTNLTQSPG